VNHYERNLQNPFHSHHDRALGRTDVLALLFTILSAPFAMSQLLTNKIKRVC